MRNYDFHELLSFDEFQRFATELVSLKSALKKEIDNVKKLKPNRYIIVTSITCTKKIKKS